MIIEVTALEQVPILQYGISTPSQNTLPVGEAEKTMLTAITTVMVTSLHSCLFRGQSTAGAEEYHKLCSLCYPIPSVYKLVHAILQYVYVRIYQLK